MKRNFLLNCLLILFISSTAQNFEWAQKIGGIDEDYGNSISIDASGNVYVTGTFQDTVDFDPGIGTNNITSLGGWDMFLIKIDALGNLVWVKHFGGMSFEKGSSVTVDSVGNIYVTGVFQGTVDFDPNSGIYNLTGNNEIFVLKLSSSGSFIWVKQFSGTDENYPYSVKIDFSGNVYTSGFFSGTIDFDPGPAVFNLTSAGIGSYYDIYISKLSSSGNFLWAERIGASGDDVCRSMSLDNLGNVYIFGDFRSTVDFDPGPNTFNLTSFGEEDIFICKLDTLGNFVWAKQIGGTQMETGFSMDIHNSGFIYASGEFSNTVDFDPGPGTFNLTVSGRDGFILKLDFSGNFIWAKQIVGSDVVSYSLAIDNSGNVYITGGIEGYVDLDPGPGTFIPTFIDGSDIFVLKLNTLGDFVWARSMGGLGLEYGLGISIDASGNIYTTGYFEGTVDFNPGTPTFNLTSAGFYDIFIHKMSNITGIEELNSLGISIFPNPSPNIIEINLETNKITEVKIYDVVGKLIIQGLTKDENEIDVSELNPGIYFVKVATGKQEFVSKFIKQ